LRISQFDCFWLNVALRADILFPPIRMGDQTL
jgi:hypothetical protein